MNKIVVGSKVRRINFDCEELKEGMIYTVSEIRGFCDNHDGIKVKGYNLLYDINNFELIEIEENNKKYNVCEMQYGYKYSLENKQDKAFIYELVKEEILNEEEKEYLRKVIKYVIKPTDNEIENIFKCKCGNLYCIYFAFKDKNDSLFLPFFKNKNMYKGMELDKEYTLEELGL